MRYDFVHVLHLHALGAILQSKPTHGDFAGPHLSARVIVEHALERGCRCR